MPIYEYRGVDPSGGCARCGPGFEQLQRLADAALDTCPDCGAPIRRLISPPSVRSGDVLDSANVARHGFTQYRRVRKGEYEKTAGRGPATISDTATDEN